jgi:hypothetical protein
VGKLTGITIDCENVQRMVSFWAAALDGYVSNESHTMLKSESGPPIYFQQVPEVKTEKARVHLDIVTSDVKGDIFRLQRIGAKMVGEREESSRKWTVMQDIEGNEFCVMHA